MSSTAVDVEMTAEEETQDEKNHRVWKKHAPFLYDTLMTKELMWPTPTLDWFPFSTKVQQGEGPDGAYVAYRLLFASDTSGQENPSLMVTEMLLPEVPAELNMKRYDALTEEVGGYAQTDATLGIKSTTADGQVVDNPIVKLVQTEEITRARCCPQNADVFAVKSSSALHSVNIFALSLHFWHVSEVARPNFTISDPPSSSSSGEEAGPNVVEPTGQALTWSHRKEGYIASHARNHCVGVWDIGSGSAECAKPIARLKSHKNLIEDIAFHYNDVNSLASCSDDGMACVWDLRAPENGPMLSMQASNQEVNCLSFNPFNPFALFLGCSDSVIRVYDLRKLQPPTHSTSLTAPITELRFHTDAVFSLQCAPFGETILASGSTDGRVLLWDLSKCTQGVDQETGTPASLLFIHEHHSPITDLCWNLFDDWLLASASENNLLHVWKMAHNHYS